MNKWLDSTVANFNHYFKKTKKPVVWDVGSRDGKDGAELARRIYAGEKDWFWSNASVVAVEANPAQAEIIKKTFPYIKVHEIAVSNAKGKAKFIVYKGNEGDVGSSSLNLRWKGDDLEGDIIHVKTARLDDLMGDQMIDIMKIDVEGYSVEALGGIGNKLKQIRMLHVETEKWTGSDQTVKRFLKGQGWTLVDEAEQYGDMPDLVWVNSSILGDLEE